MQIFEPVFPRPRVVHGDPAFISVRESRTSFIILARAKALSGGYNVKSKGVVGLKERQSVR